MKLIDLRTATMTSKGQIAIPKEARSIRGFKEGQKIAILAFDDHLELRPLSDVGQRLNFSRQGIVTAMLSEKSLAKDWLTPEENNAWKDL